eukprot:CAMPEP_0204612558 /NCGR_PEP_ID=MMETSP0717-20131115/636_1 /ASSEMBLY_ACC=CAM_ASM_000666 /TAXON_ID=230516 /ORGANISM="Chaetoceros curvisetus" /LENGTH=243 /DNA_ID=CAMNT_0051624687 /DNA_START=35 /DNA_END=763 /DNA_ORIENTATION=-
MTKQYVWLVRYGKTEFPLVEYEGPYDSDIDPMEGIEHAKAIGGRIASSTSDKLPSKIYCSPFLRTIHTASYIRDALSSDMDIQVEDGLYEWLTPSLLIDRSGARTYPKTVSELKQRFKNIDEIYKSCRVIQETEFPEDENALMDRCQNTFDGILCHANGENLVIVAHAPCVQALAFAMEDNVEKTEDSKLGKWPLGGVTRFSRDVVSSDKIGSTSVSYGTWQIDFYGSTDHMPGDYKNGLGLW